MKNNINGKIIALEQSSKIISRLIAVNAHYPNLKQLLDNEPRLENVAAIFVLLASMLKVLHMNMRPCNDWHSRNHHWRSRRSCVIDLYCGHPVLVIEVEEYDIKSLAKRSGVAPLSFVHVGDLFSAWRCSMASTDAGLGELYLVRFGRADAVVGSTSPLVTWTFVCINSVG